jgi:hypothetical protein
MRSGEIVDGSAGDSALRLVDDMNASVRRGVRAPADILFHY